MTEKEFLIKFAAFYKEVKPLHYETRENAIIAFCQKHDPDDSLDMSGFVSALANRIGLAEYLEQAIDFLTAD